MTKKSNGEELTADEKNLISYFIVQHDGYGMAITRFYEYDGGMGRASRRIWETANAGEEWNVLSEHFFSIGEYDFTYMDNVFIEAGFGTTAEKGYFNISEDRGHTYKSISYDEVFPYDGAAFAKKIAEDREEKTVTYEWIDLYSKEVISTVKYDLAMNVVNE